MDEPVYVEFMQVFLRVKCMNETRLGCYKFSCSMPKLIKEFNRPMPDVNRAVFHNYLKTFLKNEDIKYMYNIRFNMIYTLWS
jgi:hypothetical protein